MDSGFCDYVLGVVVIDVAITDVDVSSTGMHISQCVRVCTYVALTGHCARAMYLQGVWQASSSSSAGRRTASEYQTGVLVIQSLHDVALKVSS